MRAFRSVAELAGAVGEHIGCSEWHTVSQPAVHLFAEATGDHQWIHTDPVRAEKGPFGRTIAHGYFIVALIPKLVGEIYRVHGVDLVVNYGIDRLRFPAPVPVGSAIRARATIMDVVPSEHGMRVTDRVTVEIAGSAKPACVVDTIALFVPS